MPPRLSSSNVVFRVMPLVVAPVAGHLGGKAIRAVHQLVALESDVELVLAAVVLLQSASVAQQRAASVGVGLEPEHQRVVMLTGAVQGILVKQHALVLLLQAERVALREGPVGTYQHGVGALRVVGSILARAFVHRVVVDEVLLVARQMTAAVGRADESAVHGAIP